MRGGVSFKASDYTSKKRVSPQSAGRESTVAPPPPRDEDAEAVAKYAPGILDALQAKDVHDIFAKPVDGNEVIGYYDYIKKPMDFSTIRGKLRDGHYRTMAKVREDVDLMWANCMLFNDGATIFYRTAQKLKELTARKFKAARDAARNARKSNDRKRAADAKAAAQNAAEGTPTRVGRAASAAAPGSPGVQLNEAVAKDLAAPPPSRAAATAAAAAVKRGAGGEKRAAAAAGESGGAAAKRTRRPGSSAGRRSRKKDSSDEEEDEDDEEEDEEDEEDEEEDEEEEIPRRNRAANRSTTSGPLDNNKSTAPTKPTAPSSVPAAPQQTPSEPEPEPDPDPDDLSDLEPEPAMPYPQPPSPPPRTLPLTMRKLERDALEQLVPNAQYKTLGTKPRLNPVRPMPNVNFVKAKDYAASLMAFVSKCEVETPLKIVEELLSPETMAAKADEQRLKDYYAAVEEDKRRKLHGDLPRPPEPQPHPVAVPTAPPPQGSAQLPLAPVFAPAVTEDIMREVMAVPLDEVNFSTPYGLDEAELRSLGSLAAQGHDVEFLSDLISATQASNAAAAAAAAAATATGASGGPPSSLGPRSQAPQQRAPLDVAARARAAVSAAKANPQQRTVQYRTVPPRPNFAPQPPQPPQPPRNASPARFEGSPPPPAAKREASPTPPLSGPRASSPDHSPLLPPSALQALEANKSTPKQRSKTPKSSPKSAPPSSATTTPTHVVNDPATVAALSSMGSNPSHLAKAEFLDIGVEIQPGQACQNCRILNPNGKWKVDASGRRYRLCKPCSIYEARHNRSRPPELFGPGRKGRFKPKSAMSSPSPSAKSEGSGFSGSTIGRNPGEERLDTSIPAPTFDLGESVGSATIRTSPEPMPTAYRPPQASDGMSSEARAPPSSQGMGEILREPQDAGPRIAPEHVRMRDMENDSEHEAGNPDTTKHETSQYPSGPIASPF